jgi:hypothetical protein
MALAAASTQERLNALSGYRSDGRMAGEGNPTDPAQARMQVSIHVKVVGLLLVQRGHVPTRMRLLDSTSSHNTLEFGRNAGVPDGLRATETAFVHLCRSKLATVDTTQWDRLAILIAPNHLFSIKRPCQ